MAIASDGPAGADQAPADEEAGIRPAPVRAAR